MLAWGTGALNIDGCRIGTDAGWSYPNGRGGSGWHGRESLASNLDEPMTATAGRWPANVILDESQAAELDRQSGVTSSREWPERERDSNNADVFPNGTIHAAYKGGGFTDTGGASRFFLTTKGDDQWNPERANTAEPTSSPRSASGDSAPGDVATSESLDTARQTASPTSRFIYCAKAPTSERPRVKADAPQEAVNERSPRCAKCGYQRVNVGESICKCEEPEWVKEQRDYIAHPTVKPLDLMRWLVRLVTPPGGIVLDPFVGSGTTAEACVVEGFKCLAIEREADYLPLIVQRLTKPIQPDLFGGAA